MGVGGIGEDGGSKPWRSARKKLVYDKDADEFVFESREDTLKRACGHRQKETETINRCERAKLDSTCHQFEKKHRLFTVHLTSERSAGQESLKDLVAYRHVLSAIATENETETETTAKRNRNQSKPKLSLASASTSTLDYSSSNYGRYGEGAFRLALLPKIEEEKYRMEPERRRKAMCRLLLSKRRPMDVVERSLPTDQLLRSWSNNKLPKDRRLIVPPIHARPEHRKGTGRTDSRAELISGRGTANSENEDIAHTLETHPNIIHESINNDTNNFTTESPVTILAQQPSDLLRKRGDTLEPSLSRCGLPSRLPRYASILEENISNVSPSRSSQLDPITSPKEYYEKNPVNVAQEDSIPAPEKDYVIAAKGNRRHSRSKLNSLVDVKEYKVAPPSSVFITQTHKTASASLPNFSELYYRERK